MSGGARQLFDPEAPQEGASTAVDSVVDRDTHADVDSVAGLYDRVEHALADAFPRVRPLWVRGEIQHLSEHRSGHLYLDLVDPDDGGSASNARDRRGIPTLHVKCWRRSWGPLRHSLAKEGIELREGMVVVLRGTLDLYPPKGEISLVLAEIDVTALLGRMAATRARLLRTLQAEGLLRRNASMPVPDVMTHVGLVASPGTEGYRDFLGQLTGSGFAFRVSVAKVTVQGAHAPASIARALRGLSHSECDVIAMVRGGGSRADLAAFETEIVARAVTGALKPVFTGIGHTGDETVADVVAARSCVTPTECGQVIALSVRSWWDNHVVERAGYLARRVPSFLGEAESRDKRARSRLTASARQQLRVHREGLSRKGSSVARAVPSRLEASEAGVRAKAARLGPLARANLGREDERVHSWRRLLAAYDVERQLERGYSLTLTTEGSLVRSAGSLTATQEILTRFADGTVRSRVEPSGTESDEETIREP